MSCDEYPVESVVLDPATLSLDVGESRQIEVRVYPLESAHANTVYWSSSDESVARVSTDGTITAIYSGICTITAKCGKQSATCEVVVNELDYSFKFERATALYQGDEYEVGTNNFALRLLGDGITLDSDGALTGEGLFVNLDLNVPLENLSIPSGNYALSDKREAFTFFAGSLLEENGAQYATGTFVGQRTAQGLAVIFVKSGTLWITLSGDSYLLEAHLVGERNEDILIEFSGKINVLDKSGDTPPIIHTFSTTEITPEFLGDAQNIGLNIFKYTVSEADTTLQFSLYIPLSVSAKCPSGLYDFSGQRAYSVSSATFSIAETSYAISDGQVLVSQTDDAQTFSCKFVDESGRIISGTFHN